MRRIWRARRRRGEQAMMRLLTKSIDFTAVVTYNDFMAAGALSVLSDENEIPVPEKISVIGFDDVLIARYIHPRLTTVRYPIHMMAEQAATLALKLSQGEVLTQKHAFTHPLWFSATRFII